MAEESIILISKDYANSNLIERGEYTELENKVNGKQDELTAGTGINLNDNTISVDTATVVGTSNLPVTASAVNTKLGDYVNEIQAEDDSITVTKTGSSVTLKANGGGSIDENRVITGRYESYGYGSNRFIADSKVDAIRLTQNDVRTDIGIGSIKLHNEDGPVNADFTVQTMVSSFCPSATISIPCDEDGGYTAITSNGGTEVMRFQHDTSAGYDTHNTKIYFNTPVYDKDGNEITGGGSSFNYISESPSDEWPTSLLLGHGPNGTVNSIFVCGPLYGEDGAIVVKDEITFEHSVYVQGPIVDKNNYITLIQGKETWDGSGVDQVVIGDGSHSVYINGPLYDKNGNEITGGGGGGGSKYIKDESDPMGDAVAIGDYYGDKPFAIDISCTRNLILSAGNKRIFIDETKLAKLEELLNS